MRPGDVWELPGFMSYRADRLEGQGGGVLILVKSEFRVSKVVAMSGRPGGADSVGVVQTTDRGHVAILCAYAPPGPGLEGDIWLILLDRMCPYSAIFLCGDFNAHHVGWRCSRSSPRGTALFEASLARVLVSINDARPTYVPDTGSTPRNIDLIFCPLSFAHLASVEVIADPFGSDPNYKEHTAERKAEFKRKDSEVKLFLRRQKRDSFRAFCESLDPSQGINRIWRTVRALASRPSALRTNVVTDVDSAELRALRDDLVRADVPLVDIPLEEVGMVDDPLEEPFSRSEFDSAMGACRGRSAPGLDGISYEILRKFSVGMYSFMLCLFNCMFRDSSFPSSWRDTYVIFLPKPGGKGHRPISLTSSISKLFERMINRRLEHRAEQQNWVPNFQFGFRFSRIIFVGWVCRAEHSTSFHI